MNRQDESRLRSNKFTLQKRLQFEDGVMLAYLLQEEVFSEGTMHDIESKPTRSAKASALLSTLPRCGPTAFKVFVEALVESGQNDLAELLEVPPQTLAPQNEQSPAKTPTEVSSEPKENVASGESNKEQASASKTEETTEQPSTKSPEEIKQSTFFKDCTSWLIDIKLKCLPKQISEDPKARVIKTGHALVISNGKVVETDSRVGSSFDETNICLLFGKKLGFQVVPKKDLTVQEMKAAVEVERERCKGIDGFLLCIMSVGGCGRIRGVDGKTISIDELTACFDDVNCPALKGKPKIVIIETCQEGNEKCPSEPQSSAPGVDELEGALKDVHISKPKPSNMIEVRCAIKGYQTARSETYGSWFIRTLITDISEQAHQDDVVSLMKGVRLKWTNIEETKIEITVSSAEESNVYFHPQV